MSCSRTTRYSCCVPPRASSTWPPTMILSGLRSRAQRPPPLQILVTHDQGIFAAGTETDPATTHPAGDSGACAHRHGPAQLSVDIISCPPPPIATPHPRPPRPLPPHRPAPKTLHERRPGTSQELTHPFGGGCHAGSHRPLDRPGRRRAGGSTRAAPSARARTGSSRPRRHRRCGMVPTT
jgi:hypothetical protein